MLLLDKPTNDLGIGLDGGEGGLFAGYSQWGAFRGEQLSEKPAPKLPRPAAPANEPKRKLSSLQQRESEAAASHPNRVTEAYEKMQAAQRRVEDLYSRWAELESQLIPNP